MSRIAIVDVRQIGSMIEDRCPKCRSRLLGNYRGNRWCVRDDCDYYLRDGQVVTEARIRDLNARCPRI